MEPAPVNELLEWAKVLAPTAIAAIVGAVTWYFARQNHITAYNKLQLDLFDRRIVIYLAAKNLMQKCIYDQVSAQDVTTFHKQTAGVRWLLSEELDQVFFDLYDFATDIVGLHEDIELLEDGEHKPDARIKLDEQIRHLRGKSFETDIELERLFDPHMQFLKRSNRWRSIVKAVMPNSYVEPK